MQVQYLAFELIKKLVIAWDPDFTKATPDEMQSMSIAEQEFINGDIVCHEDINWD